MADAPLVQTGGLWAVIVTALTAIGLIVKGGYQFLKDLLQTRNEMADGKASRNVTLIEVTQEAAKDMLATWAEDNKLQRDRAIRAEQKVDGLQAKVDSLQAKNAELTDTVHRQGVTIAELLERIDRLEHS